MYKKFILIGVFLLKSSLSFSQLSMYNERGIETHDEVFQTNAFLLAKNSYSDTTSIALGYKQQGGDFFSPIAVSDAKGGVFDTFSLLKVSKWNLYGSFCYENLFADKSNAILSTFNDDQSPLFLFQNKSSKSQTISYVFHTMASRQIFNESTYIGLRFDYEGGSFYKKSDFRNTQNLLKVKSGLSFGKQLENNWTLGVDLLFDWKKTKPSLSSIYQHSNDDNSYKHYMSIGYGTIDKRPGYSFEVKTLSPNVIFFIEKTTEKVLHQMHIKGEYSSCIWENTLVKEANRFNKPYKYQRWSCFVDYLMKRNLNTTGILSSLLSVGASQGKSFWREDNRTAYLQAFWNKKARISCFLGYEKEKGIFRDFKVNTLFVNHRLRDKNYGNKINYSKLTTTVKTSFCFIPQSRYRPMLTLGIEFAKVFNGKKSEGTLVSNDFMGLIGTQIYDYWSAGTLGGLAKLDIRICRKRDLHFFAESYYLKNTTANLYKDTYSHRVILGMKLNY